LAVDASRFDFAFIPERSLTESVDLIRLGEELGYRGAWIPDQGFHRDPFVVVAHAADGTERIALGVGITSPYTRSSAAGVSSSAWVRRTWRTC
jgi:alkanesulfonate monooxygenase SsuD/methylene tetrahydromethanopterin reductase-like flavin-dependent oxidoreductase (luciferase family)